ncbi:hypothetical protein EIP86_003161 [Pleurotus ostreatoroseus]|nr:hypothetical protein EIP86_003161 [Pleurotus ostreatoroseus]
MVASYAELTVPKTGKKIKVPTGLFINNQFEPSVDSKETIDLVNPATEEPLCSVVAGSTKDIDAAVAAAREAFKTTWGKNVSGFERSRLINKLADLIERDAQELGDLECLNNGKPMKIARDFDVGDSVGCLRYYAGWADKIVGQSMDIDPKTKFAFTKHDPIGVCGQIIPWNYPIMMWAWKVAPALACGCTIVMKPSEFTPLTALASGGASEKQHPSYSWTRRDINLWAIGAVHRRLLRVPTAYAPSMTSPPSISQARARTLSSGYARRASHASCGSSCSPDLPAPLRISRPLGLSDSSRLPPRVLPSTRRAARVPGASGCGFPPGVINTVPSLGSVGGAALASHLDVDKVAFTGSTVTGRKIMSAAAQSNLKKVSLELGGKSPQLIFESADLEQAANWAALGILYNTGQDCTAGSRVYVQDTVYDKFIQILVRKAKETVIADGFDESATIGPVVSKVQYDKIWSYIEAGKTEGASLALGGAKRSGKGYFVDPTIFTDIKPDMKIVKDEIFGPVLCVGKFHTEEEAIKLANDTNYGLGAGLHSNDASQCVRVSSALEAGTVWVNQYNLLYNNVPFGGKKQSGIGRELGSYALEEYTSVKAVQWNFGEKLDWPL